MGYWATGLPGDLEGDVEAPANEANNGRYDEDGILDFAVDGKVVFLRNDDAQEEADGYENEAVDFDPDGAEHKIDQNFEEINAIGFALDFRFLHGFY
jgi:hypothetical protein